jgi:hypothetical protein
MSNSNAAALAVLDKMIAAVPSLPMRGVKDRTYTAPCVVGAVLTPAGQMDAQAEYDHAEFGGIGVCDAGTPEIATLVESMGINRWVMNDAQNAHDALCASPFLAVAERRAGLRAKLLALRESLLSRGVV